MTDETIVESTDVSEAPETETPETDIEDVAAQAAEATSEQAQDLDDSEVEEEGGETSEEVKEMIRSLKYKANGKEFEEELPFEIEPEHLEYLQKKFSMAAAAPEAMQKAAEKDKLFEKYIEDLKNNPWEQMEELGLNPDELAELRIQQMLEEYEKTPEQKKQEAMEKELEELRKKLQEEEEEKKRIQMEKLQKEAEIEIEADIKNAISSHTQLPPAPYVIKRMSDAMLWAMDNGHEDVSAADIAPYVEKQLTQEIQELTENLPDKALESFMSKKLMERLRKQRINNYKKSPEEKIEEVVKTKQQEEKTERKIAMKDFLRKSIKDL